MRTLVSVEALVLMSLPFEYLNCVVAWAYVLIQDFFSYGCLFRSMFWIDQVLALMEHPLRITVWMAQVNVVCVFCFVLVYLLYLNKRCTWIILVLYDTQLSHEVTLLYERMVSMWWFMKDPNYRNLYILTVLSSVAGTCIGFYCRFEQEDGFHCQTTSIVWSSFIVQAFGMISKLLRRQ